MQKLVKGLLILVFLLFSQFANAINDVYVVHLVLDGARYDYLNEMMQKGELPVLKNYFFDHGAVFDQALTTFPTVSTPGYVSFVTGLEAGNSSIFFLEWVDRTRQKMIGYLTLNGYKRVRLDLFNRIALRDPKTEGLYPKITLFDKLSPNPTAAIYTPLRQGATIIRPRSVPLAAAWSAFVSHNGDSLNKIAMKGLLKVFSKPVPTIPRYTLVSLYGTDCLGHKEGPTSEEVQTDLKKFDDLLGQFLDKLQSQNLQDKTYLIVSSDHG
ncbi:MAG: alkaline phosphatase family protein, partial [bacterium]|nr:alkaline phosphatase family protein [bacterium]